MAFLFFYFFFFGGGGFFFGVLSCSWDVSYQ